MVTGRAHSIPHSPIFLSLILLRRSFGSFFLASVLLSVLNESVCVCGLWVNKLVNLYGTVNLANETVRGKEANCSRQDVKRDHHEAGVS